MPRLNTAESCPFLEYDDHRCASHFSLGRLSEAFDICVNRHQSCPTYYRLLRETTLVTTVTLHGRSIAQAAAGGAGAAAIGARAGGFPGGV